MLQAGFGHAGLLAAAKNRSRYHREHEKYYSEAPLTDAISLQRSTHPDSNVTHPGSGGQGQTTQQRRTK
jgi:hypothetical protein